MNKLILKPDEISLVFRGHGLHASMAVKEGITKDILTKAIPIIRAAERERIVSLFKLSRYYDKEFNCHFFELTDEDWQALNEGSLKVLVDGEWKEASDEFKEIVREIDKSLSEGGN